MKNKSADPTMITKGVRKTELDFIESYAAECGIDPTIVTNILTGYHELRTRTEEAEEKSQLNQLKKIIKTNL